MARDRKGQSERKKGSATPAPAFSALADSAAITDAQAQLKEFLRALARDLARADHARDQQ
ncbi:hypothetical protein GALL_475130 [mine drainage metagenome]|uniref:Uncharacterized protein n=1 Tax=mine drainage metagenome TaxID=410659 RepID=A0A1J5PGZ2_9ZZZZ